VWLQTLQYAFGASTLRCLHSMEIIIDLFCSIKQESWATAKMTAQWAFYMGVLKSFEISWVRPRTAGEPWRVHERKGKNTTLVDNRKMTLSCKKSRSVQYDQQKSLVFFHYFYFFVLLLSVNFMLRSPQLIKLATRRILSFSIAVWQRNRGYSVDGDHENPHTTINKLLLQLTEWQLRHLANCRC